MSSPVRRSSRARKQWVDPYQVELNQLAQKRKAAKLKGSSDSESNSEEDSADEAAPEHFAMMTEGPDSSSSDEESKPPTSRKSPSPLKKTKQPKGSKRGTIQVRIQNNRTKKPTGRKASGAAANKGPRAALTMVAKKVLDESETPKTSLVAALLQASHPIKGKSETTTTNVKERQSMANTLYTQQLEGIARRLVKDYPNPMQLSVQLLNLVFRSVGGSIETNLDPKVDLEDLDDQEWDDLVTKVVAVMTETDVDCTLLCTDPSGAPSGTQSSKLVAQGLKEYRSIYEEFWFRLGDVILTGTAAGKDREDQDSSDEEDDDDESRSRAPQYSNSRFDMELVKELIARLAEVVPVGQPDLRMGATIGVLQLGLACLERSVDIEAKIEAASRQYTAASKSNMRSRMQGLKVTMEGWKRQKTELEELVLQHVVQGVFMHRYRDSNPHIRTFALNCLSKMVLMRPDLFLMDKYLKYFGWMCSDKDAGVRVAGLKGVLAPFQEVQREKSGKTSNGRKRLASLQIELSAMQHVCNKFLDRFVDCTEDAESLEVQEIAVELMLTLLRAEFLDEWDNENGWDQVNLKALDTTTSPKVRRDALYFVLDQLDHFDDAVVGESVSEEKQVQRVDGLASWVANKLCDGEIPIDKIRVHLTDCIVQSLRDMPEHKCLATNWSAMIKAIRVEHSHRGTDSGREEVAKQRVLLRMLACGAKLEIEKEEIADSKDTDGGALGSKRKRGSSDSHQPQEKLALVLLKSLPSLLGAFKGDVLGLRSITSLPRYMIASVFSLPARKTEFQNVIKKLCATYVESTDEKVLQNVAFALSELVQGGHPRVTEVKMQLSKLSRSLQERLMELLAESEPASGKPQKASPSTRSSKRRSNRTSDASGSTLSSTTGMFSEATSPEVDIEHSIYLCLLRFRVLAKRCGLDLLFEDGVEGDEELEGFCNSISEAIAKRLQDRQPIMDENDDRTTDADGRTVASTIVPEIWSKEDPNIHAVVARSVDEALHLQLILTSRKLLDTLDKQSTKASAKDVDKDSDDDMEDDADDIAVENLTVLGMRDRLTKLLGFCFDQFLDEKEDRIYSDEHLDFSAAVQSSAGRFACDLRGLFSREWAHAADPVRRKLALTDDTQLIGGFTRYLRSRENELHDLADHHFGPGKEAPLVDSLLLPVARGLTANCNDFNRREAGIAMEHISGSSETATQGVQTMARLIKRVNPVRFLEAQMACIVSSFAKWLDMEPNELEDDRPTEDQIQEYEEEVKRHGEMFQSIEQQAHRLSMSLGVGKLTDKRLSEKMPMFILEGIRFAFKGNAGLEDDLVLGSRLPFLLILSKYSIWIKKNKAQLAQVREALDDYEAELESHPEFEEVHEDDLAALAKFRESLGLKATIIVEENGSGLVSPGTDGGHSLIDDDDAADDETAVSEIRSSMVTPADSKSGKRRVSTASSQRSRLSTQTSLSPLMEETPIREAASAGESSSGSNREDSESDRDMDESPPRKQRRKTSSYRGDSLGSSTTVSKMDVSQSRIEEEQDEVTGSSDDSE